MYFCSCRCIAWTWRTETFLLGLQGHNVAGECREAATLQMSRAEVETLLSELTRMHTSLTGCKEAAKWRHAAEFATQLRALVSRMLAWLVRQINSSHLPYAMVQFDHHSRHAQCSCACSPAGFKEHIAPVDASFLRLQCLSLNSAVLAG